MFHKWFVERGSASAGKRIQVQAGGDMNLENLKIKINYPCFKNG
jgi:hypothetical protein